MLNKTLAFYLLISTVILAGCSLTKNTSSKSQKNQPELTEEQHINLQFLFVNANKEKQVYSNLFELLEQLSNTTITPADLADNQAFNSLPNAFQKLLQSLTKKNTDSA